MKLPAHLRTAAIDAHQRGEHFADFFPTVADQLRKREPFSREGYRRLHGELLCLVVCGDPDAPAPSILDDQPEHLPDDTATRARLQSPCSSPTTS